MKKEFILSPVGEFSVDSEGLQKAIDEIIELRMLSLKLTETEKYALHFILKVFKKTQSYKYTKKYATEILKKLENYNDYSSSYDEDDFNYDLADEFISYKSDNYKPRKRDEHQLELKEQELTELYTEFWSIYNKDCFHFGRKFLPRLKNFHYKNNTVRALITIMKWFYENYDKDRHTMSFGYYPNITVRDKDKNEFAGYVWNKGGLYIRNDFTTRHIEELKESGKYNKDIHYSILGLNEWIKSTYNNLY